jgi:hypothetical protein
MKNPAKNLALTLTLGLLAAGAAPAQTSGRISYEATQRVDLSPAAPTFPPIFPKPAPLAST